MCLLPGPDVSIYCALPDTSVTWSNAQFGSKGVATFVAEENLSPDIQLRFISFAPNQEGGQPCANASATINNVPKTLDGLDITCAANIQGKNVSKLFLINVIGEKNCQCVCSFILPPLTYCLY